MKCNPDCHYYADVKKGLFCAVYEIEIIEEDIEDDCSKYISEDDYKKQQGYNGTEKSK